MKGLKKLASLAALFTATAILWAAPRAAEEFDQEALAYRNYWLDSVKRHQGEKLGILLLLDDLRYFCEKHPQCLLSRVDLAAETIKTGDYKKGLEIASQAKKILSTVPESEEGKFSKAKYYRLMTEVNLYISPGGAKGELAAASAAGSCAKNNELLGAQAYYTLACYFANAKKYDAAIRNYHLAHSRDKACSLANAQDIQSYVFCCKKKAMSGLVLVPYFDKLFSASGFSYFKDFGAIAASGYETGNKDKAILAAMLDKEYTKAYADTSADDLIAILKKNYGTESGAAECIAFVQKFFDEKQSLTEDDLQALPKSDRDFLTVRYMYKMRNSSDIGALREEFEQFFGSMKTFYLRLCKKAEKNDDKEAAEEIKRIIAKKFKE
ncbi:MAG: hypothetical protein IK094_09325 [Treponema sp.]|nr:hypothetical protein [Treponema sp.]